MVTATNRRVTDHTSEASNERIRRAIEANVALYAQHPDHIARRLAELDREWDVERVLETGSSALTLSGLLLSVTSSRKWILLSLAVQGFFLQHALQGWCPPLPLLRHLGVRTADEINRERCALKAIRGDMANVTRDHAESAQGRREVAGS